MHEVALKCSCGAEASFSTDPEYDDLLINAEGLPDAFGRRYVLEAAMYSWLELHRGCVGGLAVTTGSIDWPPLTGIGDL